MSVLTMVRFNNVGMRYGKNPEVLRDINFSLETGSFHFITGVSGAGKSSLLRLLYLGHRPSRGLITMFQKDLATADRQTLTALRRRIGIVFQEFRLLDHLSLRENIALPLQIDGVDNSQAGPQVEELLDWIGLGNKKMPVPLFCQGAKSSGSPSPELLFVARIYFWQTNLLVTLILKTVSVFSDCFKS